MARRLIVIVFALTIGHVAKAQADTNTLFFDKEWKKCEPDTAYYFSRIFNKKNLWYRSDFWVDSNLLQMTGTYLDEACTLKEGHFKWYSRNGQTSRISDYENDDKISSTTYHDNGNMKSYISFKKGKQAGWDETGKKLANYIVESMPVPGENWYKYLDDNIDPTVVKKTSSISETYEVKVEFVIDTTGNVSNISIAYFTNNCKPCADELVRVITNSPKWKPAILENQLVPFPFTQYIAFKVSGSQGEKYARLDFW